MAQGLRIPWLGPPKRVEVFGTPLRNAGNLRVLRPCNPAGWEAPEPGKMGRELHSLGIVHYEGRMVLPALKMQEMTHSKIWCLTDWNSLRHLSIRLRNESENWRDAAANGNLPSVETKISVNVSIASRAARRFWKAP